MPAAVISLVNRLDPLRALDWLAQGRRPYIWIGLVWVLMVYPLIVLRGAHFEEGTLIGLARGAFEDGHWLVPHRYGERFAERPVLLSWLLGVIGLVTGQIPIWLARVPTVFALLGGALLIYRLVHHHGSEAAALFGALCFMASPLILPKVIVAESDLVVAIMLFAGVVVLWEGERHRGASPSRWIAVAAILGAAAMVKGPQPLAFFFLGFATYYLIRRRWHDLLILALVGLVPAGLSLAWYVAVYQPGQELLWARHSRLVTMPVLPWLAGVLKFLVAISLATLPSWLLLIPIGARALGQPLSQRDDLLAALMLYAGVCLMVLAVWPYSRGRYAMPAVLALAACAGLMFDAARAQGRRLLHAACWMLAGLLLYQIVLNLIVVPALRDVFARSYQHGRAMAQVIATRPGPLYVSDPRANHDFFVYIPGQIRMVPFKLLMATPSEPRWALVTPEQERELRQAVPQGQIALHLAGNWPTEWRLIAVLPPI